MIGITGDELEAMQTWNTLGVLTTCLQYMPSYITDIERDSFRRIPVVCEAVQKGMAQEGSNTTFYLLE